MRHALVIARRELAEKRFVALAAVAFAVLPFLLVIIPGLRGRSSAADFIATGAGILAIGFTIGLALILGGGIVGRDLAENRLSFYFARPVGAASIWFGKVTAAVTLIVAAFVIVIVPALLFAPRGWHHSWGGSATVTQLTLIIVGGAVVLFFIAHVISSFVRSRSAWLVVDFAALAAAAGAVSLVLRPLLGADAPKATVLIAAIIGAGLVVALIGGGAWQLSRGRTDRKRSHIALSKFVWIAIGAATVVGGVVAAWIVSATPSDLVTMRGAAVGREPWLIVGGEARGRLDYPAAFVYNAETGAYSRFSPRRINQLIFTRDGSNLLISRRDFAIESGSFVDPRTRRVEIFRRPIDRDAEESTGLTLPFRSTFAANEDGTRIVAESDGILSVYDIPRKLSLVSARLPQSAGYVSAMYFASPSLVRVYTVSWQSPARTLHAFELDIPARALRQTGELTRDAKYLGVTANADGSRLLLRSPDTLYIADGRTVALQASIPTSGLRGAVLLRDGSLAVIRKNGDHSTIGFLDGAAVLKRSFDVPLKNVWSLRETPDGRLITLEEASSQWQTYIIDATSGAIVQHIPAAPVGWRGEDYGWWGRDPRRSPVNLPKYYSDKRLLRWNYATNKGEVLLPKG
jgi:hypothetical protein